VPRGKNGQTPTPGKKEAMAHDTIKDAKKERVFRKTVVVSLGGCGGGGGMDRESLAKGEPSRKRPFHSDFVLKKYFRNSWHRGERE